MIKLKQINLTILAVCITPMILVAQEVKSLHPFFTEKDAVVEPALNGRWYSHEFGDSITFRQVGDNFYHFIYSSQKEHSKFEAVLTRIADQLILDILPLIQGSKGDFHQEHVLKIHSFYNIIFHEDMLSIACLNYQWFYNIAVKKKLIRDYQWSENMMLLTASTENLREMFKKYQYHENFFQTPLIFRRLKSDTTLSSQKIENFSASTDTFNPGDDWDYNFASIYPDCQPSFPNQDGWLGGDGAISTPISRTQNLWAFSDTFVGVQDQLSRGGSRMISNTIAISTCNEQKGWSIEYFWRNQYTDNPQPFFESHTDRYKFWPQEIFVHKNDLYVFLQKVGPKLGAAPDEYFNFSHIGKTLAKIPNYKNAIPDQWIIELIPWSSVYKNELWKALVPHKEHLYIFTIDPGEKTFLIRILLDHLENPKEHVEYLSKGMEWKSGMVAEDAYPVMKDVISGSGSSVRYHADLKQWVMVYGPHFLDNKIVMHIAPELIGPWSQSTVIYRTPEMTSGSSQYDKNFSCYYGREHIQFYNRNNKKLLITYDCNTNDFFNLVANMEIYFPRVVSITLPQ